MAVWFGTRAAPLVRWLADRHRAVVVIALLVVFRLWLADALDVHALKLVNDDGLYVDHAAAIRRGEWLGTFDELTLVKTPGYPIWLFLVGLQPIPLLVVEHALYLASGAILVAALWPVVSHRLLAASYTILAANPLLFGEDQTRLTRDLFYSSLTLLLVGALIGAYVRRQDTAAVVGRWLLLAGVALAGLALTREDTLWIVPTVAVAIAPTARARWRGRGRGWRGAAAAYALTIVPFAVTLAGVLAVSALNAAKYDEFTVIDLEDDAYRDAIGTLLRVRGASEVDFVPLPRDAREQLAAEVPRYAEIAPGVEQWVGTGCSVFGPACDDLTAAHFEWAIRYGVRVAGHYGSPGEARAWYRALADDIDAACGAGRLRCRSGHGTLTGAVGSDELADVAASFADALQWVLKPDPVPPNDAPGTLERDPDVEQVVNRDWVEVGLSPDTIRLFGWVHLIGGEELTLVVDRPGEPAEVFGADRLDSPDVAAVIGDPTADRARFDVVIECGERCNVTFRYDAIDAMVVLVDGRTPPEVVVDPAAVGVVDFATRGPEPRPLQAARLRLFDGLFWLSDYLLVGVLLVFGAVAVRGVRRTGWSATGALVVAVLVIGIGSRLATVALVDALLFDAIRAQYLLPAGFLAYALPFGLSALPRGRGAR